MMDQNKFCS